MGRLPSQREMVSDQRYHSSPSEVGAGSSSRGVFGKYSDASDSSSEGARVPVPASLHMSRDQKTSHPIANGGRFFDDNQELAKFRQSSDQLIWRPMARDH